MISPKPSGGVRFQNERTILLGMNNPYSDDPRFALYPSPKKSAGYRLWAMADRRAQELGEPPINRAKWARQFDRRNLLGTAEWTDRAATQAGLAFLDGEYRRNIVCLGRKVAKALRLKEHDWGEWFFHYHLPHPTRICVIPHPSGLCREYNDPETTRRMMDVLLDEYRRVTPEATRLL